MSDITIGPWERDEDGRYFRWFGNTKEYREVLQTSTGTIYADQIQAHGEQIQAQEERKRFFPRARILLPNRIC